MNLFKKLFGGSSGRRDKTALAIDLFTSAAFAMIQPENYRNDVMHQKRVIVFLFGALDAVLQHNGIAGSEKIAHLQRFMSRNFGTMQRAEIDSTISFLIEASRDPAWIPIMERGGQTFHDWARGDSTAPSRIVNVMHGELGPPA